MTDEDRRAVIHLLDRLCEHEEAVIESEEVDGVAEPRDIVGYRAVSQARRVWKRCQLLMLKLGEADDGGRL